MDPNDTIKHLLQQSDKAELMEWLDTNLSSATKCIIVCARPTNSDGTGGLEVAGRQLGFQYIYELRGFADSIPDYFVDDGDDGEVF